MPTIVDMKGYPELGKQIEAALERVNKVVRDNGNTVPADLQAGPTMTALCDGTATPMQQATCIGIILLLKGALDKLPPPLVQMLLEKGPPPVVVAREVPAGTELRTMKAVSEALDAQGMGGKVSSNIDQAMDSKDFGKTWHAPIKPGSKPN